MCTLAIVVGKQGCVIPHILFNLTCRYFHANPHPRLFLAVPDLNLYLLFCESGSNLSLYHYLLWPNL
jgi:hypothetical protein